jgi:hypothetical protein
MRRTQQYPARPHFLAQSQKNLLPVKDCHEEILPGITVLSAPGYTVSHSIFMIDSGGKQLCYIGDLAHHPVLLLERPRRLRRQAVLQPLATSHR